MKKMVVAVCSYVLLFVFQFAGAATVTAAETQSLVKTDTVTGWSIVNPQEPASTLSVVNGPFDASQAIEMKYQFKGSPWIALIHEITFGLKSDQGIRFQYKGVGSGANLLLKMNDASGTVYGYTIPSSAVNPTWKKVIVPRSALVYLYGGSGDKRIDWNAIVKFEFTLDYPVGSEESKLVIYNLEIINTAGVKVENPVQEAKNIIQTKKGANGMYTIHEMVAPEGWMSMSHEDGKCKFSSATVIINEKTSKALKADYDFGEKGVWQAIIMDNLSLDFSKLKMIQFLLKGKSSDHALVFKIKDSAQTVFGYKVKITKEWTKIVIPKEEIKYLYGGSGNGLLEWNNIKQIEFTIDKNESQERTGALYMRRLQYK